MESEEWSGEIWDKERLAEFVRGTPGRCVVVIDGYAVDVTKYLGEHVRFPSSSMHCQFIDGFSLTSLVFRSLEVLAFYASFPNARERATRFWGAQRNLLGTLQLHFTEE